MATIKAEVNNAAIECGVIPPPSWLSTADSTAVEMVALLRAVVDDLLDRHPWTGAALTATIAPVVETSVWTFPALFLRLQPYVNAVYETAPNRRPVLPYVDDGDWVELAAHGFAGAQRYFRRTATGLEFYRPLPAGASVKVSYVSTKWVVGTNNEWTDEANDVAIFPSRLIRFGLIYRWRRQKGMRFGDELAEYEAILARAINEDRPRRRIATDGPGGDAVHPMRVPIPDYIDFAGP